MVRNYRRKALYEVISKNSSKHKVVNLSHPPKTQEYPVDIPDEHVEGETHWPRKPKLVQVNAGKIEITVPWQFAVACTLGLVALFLVVFRLGQISYQKGLVFRSDQEIGQSGSDMAGTTDPFGNMTPPGNESKASVPLKGNRIVIQQHKRRMDLEPVQDHFAQYGIETFIEQRGDRFFLLTKETYDNPKIKGNDGYAAKQRITEIGAKYKAPPGRESFAPKLFSDAYGEKVK
ncbi:MAG: hypothetical protein ACYTBP_08650 [Planctomycetota bacterium]|jgi:hypothetical protein